MFASENPVRALVVGAGQRGNAYARYSSLFPQHLKIVGVASRSRQKRNSMKEKYDIEDQYIFEDWRDAESKKKFADCVFITNMDQDHKDVAVAFGKKGYHLLLEKPMATKLAECREIVDICESHAIISSVCHVLRYAPLTLRVKKLIEEGAIGEVATIQHLEPAGYWHYAQAYVRGNWRKEEQSTFCLLAKSCHDLDLIQMWIGEKKCIGVSSFGSLKHFTKENKPPEAADRCLDCPVEPNCPYSAKRLYLDKGIKQGVSGWPVSMVTDVVDIESVSEALRVGPFGKCVYACDNNVVDNQVVNLQYEGGATVSIVVTAFSEDVCIRRTSIFGTMGEMRIDYKENTVTVTNFRTEHKETHDVSGEVAEGEQSGFEGSHGAADYFLVKEFIHAVKDGNRNGLITDARTALYSHMLCFAAEEARLKGCVINPTIHPDYCHIHP